LEKPADLPKEAFHITFFPEFMKDRSNFQGWTCVEAEPKMLKIKFNYTDTSIITKKDFFVIKTLDYDPSTLPSRVLQEKKQILQPGITI
jgi:hypothetical protein